MLRRDGCLANLQRWHLDLGSSSVVLHVIVVVPGEREELTLALSCLTAGRCSPPYFRPGRPRSLVPCRYGQCRPRVGNQSHFPPYCYFHELTNSQPAMTCAALSLAIVLLEAFVVVFDYNIE